MVDILLRSLLLVAVVTGRGQSQLVSDFNEYQVREPTVFLPIIARNVEHLLPNWLGHLEKLDYPKERIYIWIRSDHNEDGTASILHMWVDQVKRLYHGIDINTTNIEETYSDAEGPNFWSPSRFQQIITLRQQALDEARRQWADYIFFLDCDIFITPFTLWSLIEQRKAIIAPMLLSFTPKSAFSNFWCGKDENGYYKRTEDYMPILGRKKKGCFEVVMIHSVLLIDLRRSATFKLYYDPTRSSFSSLRLDDVMVFAHSAEEAGLKFHILNKDNYGNLIEPLRVTWTLYRSQMKFQHVKLEWIVDGKYFEESSYVPVKYPVAEKAGFDEVFVINLLRRPDRRKKMVDSLKLIGIDAVYVDAFDGKRVSDEEIQNLGIQVLPKYADPFHGRPVTKGEIGCFMSHFLLWEKMVRENLNLVLFLEDDIRFEPDFRRKLNEVMLESQQVEWDFMYLGRKLVNRKASDTPIPGIELLVKPGYSWWTLGYVLRLEGAKKLLAPKPLQRFLPVDEYIPLMFDQHPNDTWAEQFEVRNLKAVSAEPFLLYPTHYIGDEGYFSDTETSAFVPVVEKSGSQSTGKVEL